MAENTWVSLFHWFFSQMAQKWSKNGKKKMVYTIPRIPRIKIINSYIAYNKDNLSKQVFFSSFTRFFLDTLQFFEANGARSPKFIGFIDEGLGSDLFVSATTQRGAVRCGTVDGG